MARTCGFSEIVMATLTAASEIEPVYCPAVSLSDVRVTVKVAAPPLATIAGAGDTASKPAPPVKSAVGVTVTFPVQAPMTPTVKVCVAGFKPASAEKVSFVTEGSCSVHTGCTVSLTAITFSLQSAHLLPLKIADKDTARV